MLVLTRKVGERIMIGDGIAVTVVRLQGDTVRLGIDAPATVPVHREEVARRLNHSVGPQPADRAESCSFGAADDPGERCAPRA